MKTCKIRIQGNKETVEHVLNYLLSVHPGMVLSKPREGTNPRYDGNQQYSSYGDIQFSTLGKKIQKEKKRKRRV